MRIGEILIKNFRCFRSIQIYPSEICLLIGENDSGKTSILNAINAVLFKRYQLIPDDLYSDDPELDPSDRESAEVEIVLIPDDLNHFTEEEHAIFSEHFDLLEDGRERLIIKMIYGYDHDLEDYNKKNFFMKRDGLGLEVSQRYSKYFGFFIIDALRDINKEISNKYGIWGKLLSSLSISPEIEKQVLSTLNGANDSLMEDSEFKKVKDDFEKNITSFLGLPRDESNIKLSLTSTDTKDLLRGIQLLVRCNGSNLFVPIDRHGTGSQSAAVLALFKAYIDRGNINYTFFAFEEPEAHLHPHIQRRLFNEILGLGTQTFITTHSTFIVDQSDIQDIILVRRNGSECVTKQVPIFDPLDTSKKFLPKDWEMTIKRYIEGNNSEIFFSRCVLLVEGDSERYAIPIFAKALNIDLDSLGISLIWANSSAFGPFIRICSPLAFDIPWVILCDEDAENNVANQLENAGYIPVGTVKKVLKKGNMKNDILMPNNCFSLKGNLESFLIDRFYNEYIKAIIELDGPNALINFIKQRDNSISGKTCKKCGYPIENQYLLSQQSKEKQVYEYVKKHSKPRYARKVAELITSNGTDSSRIPIEFKNPIELSKLKAEQVVSSKKVLSDVNAEDKKTVESEL
jgi:putative ATP-dependent endonuclease of OLD family